MVVRPESQDGTAIQAELHPELGEQTEIVVTEDGEGAQEVALGARSAMFCRKAEPANALVGQPCCLGQRAGPIVGHGQAVLMGKRRVC